MKFKFILLAIFASFLAGIIYSSNAFALTDFERSLSLTDNLYLKTERGKPVDISNSWKTIINDICSGTGNYVKSNSVNVDCSEFLKQFNDKVVNGNSDYIIYQEFSPDDSLSKPYPSAPFSLDDNRRYRLSFSLVFPKKTDQLKYHTSSSGSFFYSYAYDSTYSFRVYSLADSRFFYEIDLSTAMRIFTTNEYNRSYGFKSIYAARLSNVTYSSDYKGKKLEDKAKDSANEYTKFTSSIFEEFRECEAFDLGCLVENFLIFIRNIFAFIFNLPKIITEIFNQFFNDNKDLFSNAFTELNDNMRKKLGFLTFPFDFLGKLYQSISFSADNMTERHCFWGRKDIYSDPVNWTGLPTCPEICAKKILGDADICINFGELERRIPEVWAVGINILRFGVLLSLIEILRRKYLSVVRG